MNFFRNLSLKNKIFLVIFLITFLSLSIGFTLIITRYVKDLKAEMAKNVSLMGRVIGDYSVSDIIFQDQEEAAKTLAGLQSIPQIEFAVLYDVHGNPFALYRKSPQDTIQPPSLHNINEGFLGEHLHILHPIVYQGEKIGCLYLKASTHALQTKVRNHILTAVGIMFLLLLLSLFLSLKLQGLISLPIVKLSRIARQITSQGNYSLRVEKISDDEIGLLYDAFNDMLEKINQNTSQLQQVNEELKNKNLQLDDNRQRLQILMDTIPDAVFLLSPTGNILEVNETCLNMYGYSREEMISRIAGDLGGKGYGKKKAQIKIQQALDRGEINYEWKARRRSGEEFPVEVRLRRMEIGGKTYVLAVVTDITQRKHAEEALRQSEEKYRALFEQAPIGVFIYNTSLKITNFNHRFVEILKSTPEKLLGLDMHRLKDQRILPALKKILNGESGRYEGSYRTTTSGIEIWVTLQVTPLLDAKGKVVAGMGVVEDVTEQKHLEEELLKSRKLESVGLLAGGIAHDFNNILTAILGNISLAKTRLDVEDNIYKYLESAEKASNRAKDLTQQLLTFSRGGAPIKKCASIAELLRETADFALRGSNVRYELILEEDLWWTEMDAGQISQVLQNLIINADQAMPEGGEIHIKAENVVISSGSPLPLKAGKYVKVSVIDHGIGIPEEHLSQIFDPYFSTKQKGSGLGLATTYAIIKKHEGHITVESRLGKGTTFTFYLPAIEQREIKVETEEEIAQPRTGKVLVMDDEEMVLEIAGQIIEHLGYQVQLVRDGEELISRYVDAMQNGKPFDAILVDLTIPGGMGGKEAVERLLKIDPNLRAVVSSGYSNDPIMANYQKYGFTGVVSKPYHMRELKRVLEEVIIR